MVIQRRHDRSPTRLQRAKQAYFRRINAMNLQNPRLVGSGISNKATFEAATAHSSGANYQ